VAGEEVRAPGDLARNVQTLPAPPDAAAEEADVQVQDWSDLLGRAALLCSMLLLLAGVSVPRLSPQMRMHRVSGLTAGRPAFSPAPWARSPQFSSENGRASTSE
jgi:hypothetical protein